MNCPKCEIQLPEKSLWDKTKNGKNWIKLPNGEWHDCDNDKLSKTKSKITQIQYVCHECKTRTLKCDDSDCQLCKFDPSFCTGCKTHVSIFDAR